jgi:hypothetical protein
MESPALVQQLASGDLKALQELQKRHRKMIRAVAWDVTGGGVGNSAIEEITDLVFDALYKSAAKYDPSRPFKAWLKGIAKNVTKQWLRGDVRRKRREGDYVAIHQEPDVGSMTIIVRSDGGGSIAVHTGELEVRPRRKRCRDVNRWLRINGPKWLSDVEFMFRTFGGPGAISREKI